MKTILNESTYTYEIEKSKFIGYVFHIENEEEFKIRLKAISKEHAKATHNCYAYTLPNRQKSNDDGEPSGTAGIPILESIKQAGLEKIAVVVVRYFGGVKLGAGNLTRAYANTASETIKKANIKEIKTMPTYLIKVGYDIQNILDNYLKNNSIHILKKDYDLLVEFLIASDSIDIEKSLINLCLGKVEIQQKDNVDIIL